MLLASNIGSISDSNSTKRSHEDSSENNDGKKNRRCKPCMAADIHGNLSMLTVVDTGMSSVIKAVIIKPSLFTKRFKVKNLQLLQQVTGALRQSTDGKLTTTVVLAQNF